MDSSIFIDKANPPSDDDLKKALGSAYKWLSDLKEFIFQHCQDAKDEWNYSKAGWNYRIKDNKRVIVYIMPLDRYFRASFVFGPRAADKALAADISSEIKQSITSAKVYAEGRGFRIEVTNKQMIPDIKTLLMIKLSP